MKIALIGYGKMGKIIHQLSEAQGHKVVAKITSENKSELSKLSNSDVDVAIEFTTPESAMFNYQTLIRNNIPIVTGTTGWYGQYEDLAQLVEENKGSFFYASNFSIGVNLFYEVNKKLAKLMNQHKSFDVAIEEIHHLEKKDSPSGTAITIAKQIADNLVRKNSWTLDTKSEDTIGIFAKREPGVFGIHEVKYESNIDSISIRHEALNRKGFAQGAILAAEWLKDRTGIFTMDDLLEI